MTQSGLGALGPDLQQLRPKKIHDLVALLNEAFIDLGQATAPRGISAKVQSLWDLLESQVDALVLKKQDSHASSSSSGEDDGGMDGELFLWNQQAYLHWQLGHRWEHTLVNTHSRDHVTAKRATPLPLCDRLVDQPYEEMVAAFMARFLDMDLAKVAGRVNVRRVDYETDYVKESETFPGLSTIYAFYSVYFTLEMSLPLNFGRPLIRTQKASDVEELWFWRPSHICPSPQRIKSADLSAYEMHKKYDAAQRALEKALSLETNSVLCVLKSSFDGGQPIILLVAVYRESLNTTQIMVAQVMWNTSDDEVSEHGRAGQELLKSLEASQRLVPGLGRLAHQVGGPGNYFWDDNRKFAVEVYQLPGSCFDQPDLAQAILSRNIQVPLVLLSELLPVTYGRGERNLTLQQLLPNFEGILGRLVGPGSVLFQLMMQVSRGSIDIAETYGLESFGAITQSTDPRFNEHSVFHDQMGSLIESICRMCQLPAPHHALREKLFEVQRLGKRLSSRYWRKEAWKPLCHLAHGNFTPSSVLLDTFGSSWLFNWGTPVGNLSWQRGKAKCGGLQPIFRDLARLSVRLLMEGYPVPMSLRQAQCIATAQWVELEDISRWLDVPQSVAYLFQRKMFESELASTNSKPDARISAAQASRRVSKLVESSSMPGNVGFDNLQGRLVGRDEDALRAFRSAEALVDDVLRLPLLQLVPEDLQKSGTMEKAPPPDMTKSAMSFASLAEDEGKTEAIYRETALSHQKLLHRFGEESQRLCYERFLHDPKWLVDANHPEGNTTTQQLQLLQVDYSPLLFGLPLLEELLDMLVAPGLDPWQKAFGCSFATELCNRLLPLLTALGGKGPEISTTEDAQSTIGIDVRYAEGHRLAQRGEDGFCFGSCGKSSDGSLQFRRGRLTPEVLEKVLVGWPCPISGVTAAMVQEQRLGAGQLPHREDDLQKDVELLEVVRTARKANLWRKSAAGLYELERVQMPQANEVEKKKSIIRSMTLNSRQVAHKLLHRSVTPREAAKVKTLEVASLNDGQELQFLGRRIGLAAYVDSSVPRCPAKHGACTLALVKDIYGSFPCSLCKQVVSAVSTDAALPDPYFAYCQRCWDRTSRRFVVCSKCLREHVTMCQRGPSHQLQLLDVSPYVGIPSCSRCGKKITWPWQMNVGDGESPLEPQWFHCATCGSQRDLCLGCAPRYCPQRHRMECLSPLKGGFTCKSCGKGAGAGGGILQLYHCCICQEAKSEVVYPNGEAALADVKLTMSMNEVKVTSVVPNGPASLAGVLPGQRVMVNDQPLVSPHALEEMMDTILVEFLSATSFDASFDSAKAVRENLAFQLRDQRIFITEVRKFHARSLGVDLGCQLLTVNGKKALELLKGEKDLALESLAPPYLLRLRQSGPKLLCHQGCNAMCDGGHVMKAQYCGGVLCPKGHALKCLPSPEAEQCCESCGVQLEDEMILGCPQCLEDHVRLPSSNDKYNLLCFRCGWRLSVKNMSGEDSPYKSRGEVHCKDCGRSIMEQDEEFAGHPDARRFYHCPSCWEDGIKEDRCYFCSIRHLACPKAHRMVPCLKSPFFEDLECLECHSELFPREAAYHCGNCWWNGKRSSRCESCGSLKQLMYCIDPNARLQVVAGDAAKADVTWGAAFEPLGHSMVCCGEDTEMEVDIAMKLRGLIYPLGARMSLSSIFNFCEATVISLHETGKYVLRLDGRSGKQLLFEPDLGNHVAAGVWRYGVGQKLMVFVEGKWRELRVHKVSTYGNQHILEEVGKQLRWEIDLNSFNHSPAWLPLDDWWLELRRWEDMLLCSLGASDVFTAQPLDILTLSWPLADGKSICADPGIGIFSKVPDVDPSLWSQLLRSTTQRSQGRHQGYATAAAPVLLLGPVGSGKTQLLRRLALEAIVAHDGEMVPLLVTATQLFLGTCISARASNEALYQRRLMRRSAQDSQDLGTNRFQSADFLVIYIRMAFGAQSPTTRFLRQALHSRRLLLLVDDLHLIPMKMQTQLLQGLYRLNGMGLRVVVAGSPPPEVFVSFPATEVEPEEEDAPEELQLKTPLRKTMAGLDLLDGGDAPKKEHHRKTLASSDSSNEVEKDIFKTKKTKTLPVREEQDFWWLPQETPTPRQPPRRLWLCPPRPSERLSRAKLRLGAISNSPEEVIEEAQDSKLFESFLSVQSAPFLELLLSYTEMSILHPEAEVLAPGTPLRSSLRSSLGRSSHRDSIMSTARVSLPFLVQAKKEVQPVLGPILRGASGVLDELFTASCMQTVKSIEEMKMERGGRKAPELEGGHLKLTLRLLALKACENGSDRLEEEEANYVVEYGGSSQSMYLWRELQPLMKSGHFWLLRRCECWESWDQLVVYYVFPCPGIQSFFASLELAETWNKQFSLSSMDDAFKEKQWHPLLPILAEMLPGPMTLTFPSMTEDKARLLVEFFARHPMVTHLQLSGCTLGMQRSTLRIVAEALKRDQNLKHLDLSDNCLGSEGVHTLCQALMEHPTLEELVLDRNHIGQVGSVKIVDLLRVNHNILRVELDENPIGSEWARYIYVLQRDRSATLASARKCPLLPAVDKAKAAKSGAGSRKETKSSKEKDKEKGRNSLSEKDELISEMKELKPAMPLSSRLRRKEEDTGPVSLSARTPMLR